MTAKRASSTFAVAEVVDPAITVGVLSATSGRAKLVLLEVV